MTPSSAVFLSALLFLVLSAVGAQGHTAGPFALRGGRKLQGGTCANGLPGIDGINGACCPLKCGQCGGDNCAQAPGGSTACCATGVIKNNQDCAVSKKAPCYIPERDGTCSNGIPGIEHGNVNGHVCCDSGCGVCGGAGCNDFPGGSQKCCINTILEKSMDCADSGEAPCYLSGRAVDTPVVSTPAPVDTIPTTPVGEGATCSNGVPGIDGSNEDGEAVCCPLSCRLCGGAECGKAPGGNKACCANGILKSDKPDCAVTPTAPCFISADVDSTPAPTPATVEEGQTCSNGFPGIDGSNSDGDMVCCPLECKQGCGGQGCGKSGATAGLDNTSCCPNGIVANRGDCTATGAAPCVIAKEDPVLPEDATPAPAEGGDVCSNGVEGIDGANLAGQTVCCPLSCDLCGGDKCGMAPGGNTVCCPNGILKSNKPDCAVSLTAPCIISTEVSTPAPVDSTPAPIDVATPAPVDLATPAPVDVATPAPVELATPAPVDVATPAPVDVSTPAPIEDSGGPTCPSAGGIAGIQNNKLGAGNGVVCCDPGCAQCGDKGCDKDPLGISSCCIGPIIRDQGFCDNVGASPCIIEIYL